MEYENLRSLTHCQVIMTPRTLKTVAKYLVSISVFTFIYYSQYSSWCCFMLHLLKFYLSAIPLHALDKRWIFLICNGILVVIASTSGLMSSRSSPGSDLNDRMVRIKIGYDRHIPPAETKDKWLAELIENAVAKVEEEDEENDQGTLEEEEEGKSQDDQCFEGEQGGHLSMNLIEEDHEEQEVGSGALLKLEEGEEREAEGEEIRTYYALEDLEDHHQENEEDLEAAVQVEEEEEEEEEHGMEKLSADELNKKFEDFIRKMKEELRIEAQQQLVVVVK